MVIVSGMGKGGFMSKEVAGVREQDFEAIVCRVKDVLSARVVVDEEGNPTEIHVLARLRRSARQVVRDVESVMLTTFGKTIDSKKISVAQIREESETAVIPMRLALEGVKVSSMGTGTEAEVTLRSGDRLVIGCSSGPRAFGNRLRVIAQAAAEAVLSYLGTSISLHVSDVSVVSMGDQRVALVSVSLIEHLTGRERQLIGSSFVKSDDREAVARAMLDAVNRQMERQRR